MQSHGLKSEIPSRGLHAQLARSASVPLQLTHDEALLVNHFIQHLGRWLDCTNAPRVFTLIVAAELGKSDVLLHAVLCFAARHLGRFEAGEAAYERCVALLIERLGRREDEADERVLAAVLMLHFSDQLNSPNRNGSRDMYHLKGTSSLLRASMHTSHINPMAVSLQDSAFWIYVRQTLYNATISQTPLDLDFSLSLQPTPETVGDGHPLSWLCSATAWANSMLWTTACVANFCFSGPKIDKDGASPAAQWQELWDRCQYWLKSRPKEFDAIGSGPALEGHAFSEIWFAADWHVISHVFYNFSCILLLRYKPETKFRTRWVRTTLRPEDRKILQHTHAICTACKSSMENAQLLIILCHTVFIWGPLLSDAAERREVIEMLEFFEATHSWRTEWIIEALKTEWGMV